MYYFSSLLENLVQWTFVRFRKKYYLLETIWTFIFIGFVLVIYNTISQFVLFETHEVLMLQFLIELLNIALSVPQNTTVKIFISYGWLSNFSGGGGTVLFFGLWLVVNLGPSIVTNPSAKSVDFGKLWHSEDSWKALPYVDLNVLHHVIWIISLDNNTISRILSTFILVIMKWVMGV